ncbi:hypothetical protein CHISP_3010 [Chitinispirillum alkaliphilum]|nr:hypothetical protein CHISP_3010 [Chitinispirillum alkaliphilum]
MRGRKRTRLKHLRASGWEIQEDIDIETPEGDYILTLNKNSQKLKIGGSNRTKAIYKAYKKIFNNKSSY